MKDLTLCIPLINYDTLLLGLSLAKSFPVIVNSISIIIVGIRRNHLLMKAMKESQRVSLKKIYEDYEPDSLNDTEEMYALKEAIKSLPVGDRAIMLLYTDLGSIYKVGELLHVHPTTVYSNLKRIKEMLKKQCL